MSVDASYYNQSKYILLGSFVSPASHGHLAHMSPWVHVNGMKTYLTDKNMNGHYGIKQTDFVMLTSRTALRDSMTKLAFFLYFSFRAPFCV
jgi:hypothetical protein